MGDGELVGAGRPHRRIGGGIGDELEIENLLALAAHQRENAVRRELGQRLGEIEVVGELRSFLLLAFAHARRHFAARPEIFAQAANQLGVLGEAFDQDRPRAVERVLDGRNRVGFDESRRLLLRIAFGMGEQPVGQRFEAVLAGDLRLGAPLGLVGQIDVLEPRLGVGCADLRFERGVELALGADGIEDRFAAFLQLAQVAQPFFERAQLRIVERARRLLAVAGDERHGRAAVEQLHRRGDLTFGDAQFFGDALGDGLHAARLGFDKGTEGLGAEQVAGQSRLWTA